MKIVKVVVVQLILLAAGLVGVELALAYFLPLPVHGGVFVDRDGARVRIAEGELTLKPNLDVTHVSAEFSTRTRTNALGYRRTGGESGDPEVVFLGDSFTFGHGVSDEEAFASIVCTRRKLACQNLGRAGTDTFDQLRILNRALDSQGMRPRTVVLVMLAACWLDSYGNDLGDNQAHYLRQRAAAPGAAAALGPRRAQATPAPSATVTPDPDPGRGEPLIKTLQRLFGDYEIAKRLMLIASSGLKRGLYRCSTDAQLDAAMEATRVALAELERLAARYGFAVALFTIHPYQELDGSYRTTEAFVRRVVPPSFAYVPTARHFRKHDYYPYDGHFNAQGHARMVELIAERLPDRNP